LIPALGVYFVFPESSASFAAVMISAGVLKSGSPAPNEMTSLPSAFIAFALAVIARVGDGFSKFVLSERFGVFNSIGV
jgi:hypothetical protein